MNQKWIDTKDRLPETNLDIFMKFSDGGTATGFLEESDNLSWRIYEDIYSVECKKDVAQWMYIPRDWFDAIKDYVNNPNYEMEQVWE